MGRAIFELSGGCTEYAQPVSGARRVVRRGLKPSFKAPRLPVKGSFEAPEPPGHPHRPRSRRALAQLCVWALAT